MAKARTIKRGSPRGDTPLAKAVAKPKPKPKPKLPKGKGVAVTTPAQVAPVIAYPINKLPSWTLSPQSTTAYSQTTDRGYDVEAMRLNATRRELAMAFANGVLSTGLDPNKDTKMPFFVTGVSIDWALAGTTAQARLNRDFYPHNFVQPSFIVQGISLNQYEYGEMVEFIHQAQHDALNNGSLIQLNIFPSPGALDGGRSPTQHGHPARGVRTSSNVLGNVNHPNQIIRGHHDPITCQGYVGGMQRKHQKGVFVPTWQFHFTVAVMIEGPYKEQLRNLAKQKNWTDMLRGVSLFQTQALIQSNAADLDWVTRESSHIFDVTEHAATSSATGSGGTGSGTSSIAGALWKVKASAELASSGIGWTELSSNGNGAAAAGHTQSPNCQGGSVGACDFATLGKAYPHGTMMHIINPANGKSGTFPLTDVGNGSSFGPAIGLTPAVQSALGWSGGEVQIQLADGSPMSVVSGFGSLVSGGTPGVTGNTQQLAHAILANHNISLVGRLVQQDIQAAEAGKPGSAGAMTSSAILRLIAVVGQSHSVSINAMQSGGTGHAANSYHYTGDAVDFGTLNGVSNTGRNAPAQTIMQIAFGVLPKGSAFGQSSCGSTPTLPSGWTTFPDSCNHLHVQVPRGTP